MTNVFCTRMLRLASLLDAMGFEYSGAGVRGVRTSMGEPAQFTFIFSAYRHDGLSAFDVLKAVKANEEIPQGKIPMDDDLLQSLIGEAHNKLLDVMRSCEESGKHVFVKVETDKGTAFIPQNATPEDRAKYAKLL